MHMERTDAQKLAAASSFLLWIHSPVPTQIHQQKLADGLPPAEGQAHLDMAGDYKAPLAEVLSAIQTMIETELATALAYSTYAASVRGFSRITLADEFQEHADKETEHAEYLMRRASVLGGPLQLNPITPPVGSTDPTDIIQRMVRMEQEGLVKWRLLHSLVGDTNPMKFKIEEYLTDEEEHLDDLLQLLPEELRPPQLQGTLEQEQQPSMGGLAKAAGLRKLADFIPTPLGEQPSSLDAQAKAEEDAAAAAYFQQRSQELQAQQEQAQQQLMQLNQQLQQKEQEVAQKDQLMQQQQAVAQQASDTAARALANQLSTMQSETLLRQQTTDTVAGHEAWKQNVMQALSAPVPHPNQPEASPEASAEGGAQPPPEGPQPGSPISGGQGTSADTSPLADTSQQGKVASNTFAKDLVKEVAKEQMQGLAPRMSLARGATLAGLAGLGAGASYLGAKSPATLEAAQAAVTHAQGQHDEKGGFMNALQLARSKAQLARAEAEAAHPGAAAGVGALKGGLAGLSVLRAVDAIKNI
jgi:bacterioferritin (cytochrome b1)